MRICLLSPATINDLGDIALCDQVRTPAQEPPIGVLTLAAILESHGLRPEVVDMNRVCYEYLGEEARLRDSTDFCEYAASQVSSQVQTGFDVIGLSTICSSYPLTLRLAARLKRMNPDALILLGGPQASAVDWATLEAFPAVDIIARGEADETLVRLLDAGVRSSALAFVPGITFRNSNGHIVRNPDAPLVADLDCLPFPAFHLMRDLRGISSLSLEIGRGCPFSCTFCSTNDFFRRRFRLKSPATMLEHMRRARREFGVTSFSLVHDMFTVDRKRVVEFCHALLDSGEGFKWNCSARTDCVDEELIDLMATAGCRNMFFGIETGSARLQKIIEKDLDLRDAASRLEYCARRRVGATVSIITGFPEETPADVSQTIDFLMDAARYDSVDTQLHILAPLAGTPIERRFRDRLVLDEVYSDMSHQGWMQDGADRELIAAHPGIFVNFYGLPAPDIDRNRLKRLREFVTQGLARFRWLLIALHQSRGGLVALFDEWEAGVTTLRPGPQPTGCAAALYYASAVFRRDFIAFARRRYASGANADAALDALVRFEEILLEPLRDGLVPHVGPGTGPRVNRDVRLIALDVDLGKIIESLRRGEGLPEAEPRQVCFATRPRKSDQSEVLELTPFSASFLGLCDGSRTLENISREFEPGAEFRGIPPHEVCIFAFEELRRQGLVTAGV